MMNAMFEEKFIKLVEENGGFEYYQAYRGDVDLILGRIMNLYIHRRGFLRCIFSVLACSLHFLVYNKIASMFVGMCL